MIETPNADSDPVRIVGIGAALLVLGVLLWLLLPLLNPVLAWAALVAVLFPFRDTRIFLPLVVTTGVFTVLWLLGELGALLAPFVVAVVLAYILNPLVDGLARARPLRWIGARFGDTDRLPRTVAVALLAIPVAGGVAAAIIWGVPWAVAELAGLARRAPEALERLAAILQGLEARLARLRIPGVEGSELAERIGSLEADDIVAFLEARQQQIGQWLLSGALGFGRGVGTFLTILGYLVLTPVVAFYLMRDWDRVVARGASLVPVTHAHLLTFGREYDRALAGYLRGQLTVTLVVGGLTTVGLLLVGFPYALLLGIIVAIFGVVPYLGLVLSLIPALAIALASEDVGSALLRVALVYGVVQTLEGAVVSPRIVGDSTGLHPVWILLAIAVGGFFFGFVGLLLAVPVAVGIKILAIRGLDRYRRTHEFVVDDVPAGALPARALPAGERHPAAQGE